MTNDRSRSDFTVIPFYTQIGPPILINTVNPTGYTYRDNFTDVQWFIIPGDFLNKDKFPAYIIVNSYHVGDSRHEVHINGSPLGNISQEPSIPYNDVLGVPQNTTNRIVNFTSWVKLIPREMLYDNDNGGVSNPYGEDGKNKIQIFRTPAQPEQGIYEGNTDAFYISYCIIHWKEKE